MSKGEVEREGRGWKGEGDRGRPRNPTTASPVFRPSLPPSPFIRAYHPGSGGDGEMGGMGWDEGAAGGVGHGAYSSSNVGKEVGSVRLGRRWTVTARQICASATGRGKRSSEERT